MTNRVMGGEVCRPTLIFNYYQKTKRYEKVNDGHDSGLDAVIL